MLCKWSYNWGEVVDEVFFGWDHVNLEPARETKSMEKQYIEKFRNILFINNFITNKDDSALKAYIF